MQLRTGELVQNWNLMSSFLRVGCMFAASSQCYWEPLIIHFYFYQLSTKANSTTIWDENLLYAISTIFFLYHNPGTRDK